jgi:hypothetical protein
MKRFCLLLGVDKHRGWREVVACNRNYIGVLHINRNRRAWLRWVYDLLGGSNWQNSNCQSGYPIAFVICSNSVQTLCFGCRLKLLILLLFKSFWSTLACTTPIPMYFSTIAKTIQCCDKLWFLGVSIVTRRDLQRSIVSRLNLAIYCESWWYTLQMYLRLDSVRTIEKKRVFWGS